MSQLALPLMETPSSSWGLTFYLGTHKPHHLGLTSVPLFVSNRTLYRRKSFPRARGRWALDSGGFSELSLFGEWTTTARDYVRLARRYRDEIGKLDWAAPQDWMCEPFITDKTGLTVLEHQRRTIDSVQELRDLAPEMPWIPVLQGWRLRDYLHHLDMYAKAGIDIASEPVTGVGSVCRRQATSEGVAIVRRLVEEGVKVHGFGFKQTGLLRHNGCEGMVSADSLAWSFSARYRPPMSGHTHKTCANCLPYALLWRSDLMALLGLEQFQ